MDYEQKYYEANKTIAQLEEEVRRQSMLNSEGAARTLSFKLRMERLQEENRKLKELLLLTDPVVANVEMNEVTLKQANEFLRWEKEGQN